MECLPQAREVLKRAYLIRETGYTYRDLKQTPADWLEETLEALQAINAYEVSQLPGQR